MKKLLLLSACLLLSASLSSQQRGATPIPKSEFRNPNSTTRAVVVGISDYQDPKIPDLRFADRDAIAFAAYLRSPAGGSLTNDQIMLLTNGQAKVGNLVSAFTWLKDESKPGDQAIIYFSGHGDVESVTMFQDGYLLGYDTPPTTYMAGGLSVYHFKRIIHTLSANGVQVVTILDACRAGKLAGSEFGGAKATTAALMEQFANEVKILSCQPDEFSQEGEEWGGGRGAFSYHLVDGLYGLADHNADLQVNLMEIGNYLEETVPKATAPLSQIPMTVGNPKTRLALVNEAWLAGLKAQKAGQVAALKSIESKGMEEVALAKADTSVQRLYREFLAAIERGDLMPPKNGPASGKSADDYYRRLIAEPELAQLHGLMKRNFAAALQNEAQEVTNKLLKTDPNVATYSWSRPFVFDHIPAYLERAAEILGEEHFFYNQLKAKQYFFEGRTYRKDNHPGTPPDSLVIISANLMEKALTFDSNAAYVYVDLGLLYYYGLTRGDKALDCALKALALSPNWVYAHYLAGNCYRGNPQKVEFYLLRALELDSTFLLPYQELSLGRDEKSAFYRDKYIRKVQALIASDPEKVPANYRSMLGASLWQADRYKEAEKELLIAEKLTEKLDPAVYFNLMVTWIALGQYEKALGAAKKWVELNPYNLAAHIMLIYCYQNLNQTPDLETLEKTVSLLEKTYIDKNYYWHILGVGKAYQLLGREQEAQAQFNKILEWFPDPKNDVEIYSVGKAWLSLGDLAAMQRTIDDGLQKFPGDVMVYCQAACLYSMAKDEQKALEWLELAFEKGFKDVNLINTDFDIVWIRDKPGFKALLKKHFPENFKD